MKYILILISITQLYSSQARSLVEDLSIEPGKKASIQWERIFLNERKMKKYKIDTLTKKEQIVLKLYLLSHSADSDSPELAGDF